MEALRKIEPNTIIRAENLLEVFTSSFWSNLSLSMNYTVSQRPDGLFEYLYKAEIKPTGNPDNIDKLHLSLKQVAVQVGKNFVPHEVTSEYEIGTPTFPPPNKFNSNGGIRENSFIIFTENLSEIKIVTDKKPTMGYVFFNGIDDNTFIGAASVPGKHT